MKKLPIMTMSIILSLALLLSGCATGDNADDINRANGEKNGDAPTAVWDISRADEIGSRPLFDIPHREKAEELFPELFSTFYRAVAHENGIYTYATSVHEADKGRQFYFCDLDTGRVTSPFSALDDFSVWNYTALLAQAVQMANERADTETEPSVLDNLISLARRNSQLSFLRMGYFGDLQVYASALYGDFKTSGFSRSNDGAAMIPQYIFGISSASQNVEGAWAFLRFIYEYEQIHTLTGIHFPMSKAAFNKHAEAFVAWQEDALRNGGGEHGFSGSDGIITIVPPIPVEQVPEITLSTEELMRGVSSLYMVDTSILNIVYEELPYYFYGSRSAEDTAHIIQDRVQTYLWELR